jgi:hypothetical protein
VCFGTGCFLKGAQQLFNALVERLEETGVKELIELKTSFCFKVRPRPGRAHRRPDSEKCTIEKVWEVLSQYLAMPASNNP